MCRLQFSSDAGLQHHHQHAQPSEPYADADDCVSALLALAAHNDAEFDLPEEPLPSSLKEVRPAALLCGAHASPRQETATYMEGARGTRQRSRGGAVGEPAAVGGVGALLLCWRLCLPWLDVPLWGYIRFTVVVKEPASRGLLALVLGACRSPTTRRPSRGSSSRHQTARTARTPAGITAPSPAARGPSKVRRQPLGFFCFAAGWPSTRQLQLPQMWASAHILERTSCNTKLNQTPQLYG